MMMQPINPATQQNSSCSRSLYLQSHTLISSGKPTSNPNHGQTNLTHLNNCRLSVLRHSRLYHFFRPLNTITTPAGAPNISPFPTSCIFSSSSPPPSSCSACKTSSRTTLTEYSSLSSASPSLFSPSLPNCGMSSCFRKTSCQCKLLSQAKEFIADKLGLSANAGHGEAKGAAVVEASNEGGAHEAPMLNNDGDGGEEEAQVSEGSPQSSYQAPKQKPGTRASMGNIAQGWRELQGLNHWKGLLDPLDLDLRKTVLFYGDFNQAVYDSFETDEHSKYTGSCRFAKEDFFQGVHLENGRDVQYDVVRYLYAASTSIDIHGLIFMKSYSREAWSEESNWIGYVAVSNDEATKVLGRRDIVIVWRGTMRPFEWLDDFDFRKADITPLLSANTSQEKGGGELPSIERGWLIIYTNSDPKSAFTPHSARDQVLNEVRAQLLKYKDEDVSISIMGHSLGAALAVVNAFDITLNKLNLRPGKEATLVTAFVYGCPGVGDEAFAKKCEELEGLRILRVKNNIDLITHYPGWLMGYRQVGDELLFSSLDSTYLKESKQPGDWHNLEVHLHMVAGTQGVGKPFKFSVNRDVALINKSSEALRDDFLIPGSWWQMQFKGLVQREDGFWYMPDRQEGKRPEPEPLNDIKE